MTEVLSDFTRNNTEPKIKYSSNITVHLFLNRGHPFPTSYCQIVVIDFTESYKKSEAVLFADR